MRIFFDMACAMALTTSLAFPVSSAESDERSTATVAPSSLSGGIYSLLRQHNPRGSMTCDKLPRVCRARGSAGLHCCRKQCVNVMTDNQNCGQCGKKCWFDQACCGGSCVNVMHDPKNCGGCNKRCKKGCFCQFGMCSYA
ncbi:Stigma-specific protein, Stig1 [Musa troglodytarum]|uniref:Stigma-specific protein, Stig1 n=4 Tax=Musa troglodytarum TaxID=320322 RepID=A0A9E7K3N9_9LILI|nr:Stigma-specific protein, Stig1 [Musa troglodytarum]